LLLAVKKLKKKKQKKNRFSLSFFGERGGGAAELRQKQTNASLSRFGRVSGTHAIHSFDRFSNPWELLEREFPSISENSRSHLAEEVS
jgi:hypothetical protein